VQFLVREGQHFDPGHSLAIESIKNFKTMVCGGDGTVSVREPEQK